jgi:predicted dienelactone hydrolase
VLDALLMEKAGIPAACIGIEKLVKTTGKGMARAQGIPDYPIAVISHPMGSLADLKSDDEVKALAAAAASQVEAILIGER